MPSNTPAARASRKYYVKNRERRIQESKDRAQHNRAILQEFKRRPCCRCGVVYPQYVLDLHHVEDHPDNHKQPGTMLTYSETRFRAELDKCVVICANCHRKEHYHPQPEI